MIDDQALIAQLKQVWTAYDPVPPNLVDRVLFGLELEDVDIELMTLVETHALAGARGTETATTITFNSTTLTVMLTVSPDGRAADGGELCRLDGWIAPAAALRVEVRAGEETYLALADEDGRFSVTAVPAGMVQLRIEPTEGAAVALTRPVVTPAVQL